MLKNLVFLELKRGGKNIYYHRQKSECDFVIKEVQKICQAIQVSATLYEKDTYDRELKGLKETMEYYKLDSGLIITENEEDSIAFSGKQITVKPAWKWLLGY